MAGKRIDVESVVNKVLKSVKLAVDGISEEVSLGILSSSDDYASSVYMKKKVEIGKELGIRTDIIKVPTDLNEAKRVIVETSKQYTAIIRQLPMADELKPYYKELFDIAENDADGLYNGNKRDLYDARGIFPCTARGIWHLINTIGERDITGAEVLIIGRSDLVGKPLASKLISHGASVTIVGSTVVDLKKHLKNKDYIITAVGKAGLFTSNDISDDTVVIDVGITRDANNKLTGDMLHIEDSEVNYSYTPVPKGVGLLTTAFLFVNTMEIFTGRNDAE